MLILKILTPFSPLADPYSRTRHPRLRTLPPPYCDNVTL